MYSPETVNNVFPALKNTIKGEAIFTFPKPPIKCPGAPQKIMYLAEDYFTKVNFLNLKTSKMINFCTLNEELYSEKANLLKFFLITLIRR